MNTLSIQDTADDYILTLNKDTMVFSIESKGLHKETRLKPFMCDILYTLFKIHPNPLSYHQASVILKKHHLIVSDLTRLHRKFSEIRKTIIELDPRLHSLLLNTRQYGYTLPLSCKALDLEARSCAQMAVAFANPKLAESIALLDRLVAQAIEMTKRNALIRSPDGYIMNRDMERELLVQQIELFKECERIILKEIRCHEADFYRLRIEYTLAKIKTYIGLARISEYPITESQWVDWFQLEVSVLVRELKRLCRDIENQ